MKEGIIQILGEGMIQADITVHTRFLRWEHGCLVKYRQNEASIWNGVSESNRQKARDTIEDGGKVSL